MRGKDYKKKRQKNPFVMIPKAFNIRFKPTWRAQGSYSAIRFFATTKTGTTKHTSVTTLARHADFSERSFKRGLAELVKFGVVRVQRQTRRTPDGSYTNLPNLYEIVDFENPTSGEDDAPI